MEGVGPTALIGAYEPGPGPGGLRALLPLAGMSLIEHQARRAIEAGAARVLLLIDEAPAELIETIARLRHDGIPTGMARGIDQAADALAPDEAVLLVAESCLADVDLLHSVATARMPALAVLPDTEGYAQFERIDAEQRWAGVALLDGHRIGDTAAMIGSWDPVSTLLRRAVQEGAARIAGGTAPTLACDSNALATAERAIMANARRPADDLIGRVLFAPTEEFALPLLLARKAEANMVAGAAAGLSLFGGALGLAGWRWMALLALMLSGLAAAGAARLARIRQRSRWYERLFGMVRLCGAGLGAIGLSWDLATAAGQWGWWLTGGVLIAAMAAQWVERGQAEGRFPVWLASVDTMIWAMLPFAIYDRWDWGFASITAYAVLSFGWFEWIKAKANIADK